VVLSDDEFVVARANTVSVPAMSEDISEKVYKITYPITKTFINVDTYIGNGIGNKVVSMQIHNPRQLKALAILSSGIDAIKTRGGTAGNAPVPRSRTMSTIVSTSTRPTFPPN